MVAGAFIVTIKDLVAPEPQPKPRPRETVPARVHALVLSLLTGHSFSDAPTTEFKDPPPTPSENVLRTNVLLLSLGALILAVIAMAVLGPTYPKLVIAMVSAVVGGLVATIKDLLTPEPEPEPEPPETVPASIHTDSVSAALAGRKTS